MNSGHEVREDERVGGKVPAILETAILEAAFFLIAWYLSALNLGHLLPKVAMIVLALLGVAIHGSPKSYGFSVRNPWKELKWSLYVLLIMLGLGGAVAYLCLALGLGAPGRVSLSKVVTDALHYLVMVGFAEELFFRGYVQSRLNEVFTREYESLLGFRCTRLRLSLRGFLRLYESLLGFRCTWHQGTLITAILYFGLPHVLTGINPLTGKYGVSAQTLMIAASACFLGLIFGVMREKTGNIILPTITHFSIIYSTFSLFPSIAGGFASIIAPVVALFVFFLKPFQDFLNDEF